MPFSVLSRECSLDAHGLLRFRTNDVLLGTSGVGVCMSVVSNSPGIFIFINYYFYAVYSRPPAPPIISSASSAGRQLDGRVASGSNRQGDPYNFFSPKRAQFCSRCLLRFDPAFSGSRLVRCSFSSRECARCEYQRSRSKRNEKRWILRYIGICRSSDLTGLVLCASERCSVTAYSHTSRTRVRVWCV